MYTIGFTTKFYTLWDVTVETFTTEYGRKGRRVTATFIKNVSMDEQAARDEIAAAIDLNGCVDLLNITNIKAWDENEYGSETAVERVNLIWDFAAIERFEYNGYEYFLPVKDGKAKRIKGKKLHIIADHYTHDRRYLEIHVKGFEIVK